MKRLCHIVEHMISKADSSVPIDPSNQPFQDMVCVFRLPYHFRRIQLSIYAKIDKEYLQQLCGYANERLLAEVQVILITNTDSSQIVKYALVLF